MGSHPIAEVLTVSIPQAVSLTGLGRTTLYKLLDSKEIESVKIGSRRLIVYASLKALLSTQT